VSRPLPANLDPDPDTYLPDKRAAREVPPLYLSPAERQRWRTGGAEQTSARNYTCVRMPLPTPDARRGRNPQRYVVAWRDQWGDSGQSPYMTRQQAETLGRWFERPGCWAALIDRKDCRILKEYGTRFADLLAARERQAALQVVGAHRKSPERERQLELPLVMAAGGSG